MKFSIKKAAAVAAAGLALAGGAFVAPANAAAGAGAVAFTGTATLGCFGCGSTRTDSSFSGTAVGAASTAAVLNGPITATGFAYSENVGDPTCVITGTASGNVSFAGVTAHFNWTRVGAYAVITLDNVNGAGLTNGTGAGAAAFAVTSPVGDPCGQAVTAQVVGAAVVADTN